MPGALKDPKNKGWSLSLNYVHVSWRDNQRAPIRRTKPVETPVPEEWTVSGGAQGPIRKSSGTLKMDEIVIGRDGVKEGQPTYPGLPRTLPIWALKSCIPRIPSEWILCNTLPGGCPAVSEWERAKALRWGQAPAVQWKAGSPPWRNVNRNQTVDGSQV